MERELLGAQNTSKKNSGYTTSPVVMLHMGFFPWKSNDSPQRGLSAAETTPMP